GTSDPYVKFKVAGKEVFRSRTIHKNLNPVWDEKASLLVETLRDPLYVKVFDYDFGLQDDFMGSAYLYLESLEHQRTLDVTLDLKDPQYPDDNLGTLDLSVTLSPKEGDVRDATMLLRRNWKRSSKYQSMRLSDVHRKAQLWRGIVSISLIEGRRLKPMDANGLSDPYVKFRMGHQKYKSKVDMPPGSRLANPMLVETHVKWISVCCFCQTIAKTLNPQWREQFDLHLYDEQGGVVDITVWDKDAGKKDDFMGRCTIDLSLLGKEHTHKLELLLEEGEGVLVLLVTLTASAAVSISDLSVNMLDDPHERHQITQRYVTNLKAIEGKIQNGERKAYALKSKELTGPTKGVIFLEIDVIFNAVKAGLRTLLPMEQKYIEMEPRVSKQLLLRNFYRVRRCIMFLINTGYYINSCFEWESPQRSICAFVWVFMGGHLAKVLFVIIVWNFELYMIPLALAAAFGVELHPHRIGEGYQARCVVLNCKEQWRYRQIPTGIVSLVCLFDPTSRFGNAMIFFLPASQAVEDLLEDEEEDFDKDDKGAKVVKYAPLGPEFENRPAQPDWAQPNPGSRIEPHSLRFVWVTNEKQMDPDSERKGFMNKLYAIQDVCISVQNALDDVASYGERIKNTFNWTVPFLSWLAIVALGVATTVIYFIPLRYIVLAWGVNKFTKKLRDPYIIDNNELLDFLSRVPSDVQVVQYRELKLDPNPSPNKRKKNNPG
ncbi:unnamed protein product, partial [Tetraodon nigroviridis]